MKRLVFRRIRSLILLLSALSILLPAGPCMGAAVPERVPVGRAVSAFGFDVFREAGKPGENLLVSPYSLATALAMVRAGSQGRTFVQMDAALRLAGIGAVDRGFAALQDSLQTTVSVVGRPSNTIRVTNGVWVDAGFPILPGFRQTAEGPYTARVTAADFRRRPEPTRVEVNGWVADQTEGKIKDLIPAGGVTDLTRLLLVNALYFKNAWEKPFDRAATSDEAFFLQGTQEASVPTMHLRRLFLYGASESLQLLQMRYESGDTSMWIVLPKQRDGLLGVESWLTADRLEALVRDAAMQDVAVALPKFTFRSTFALAKTLTALGMRDAFDGHADFSALSTSKELCLSEVYHQTFVDVTEHGTEAAAATAASMSLAMAMPRERPNPIPFVADHPFLVFIRHDPSGAILFQGRVTNPRP